MKLQGDIMKANEASAKMRDDITYKNITHTSTVNTTKLLTNAFACSDHLVR